MKNSMLHSLNLSSLYIGHSQYNPPKTKGMKHKKRPRPSWVYFIFFLCSLSLIFNCHQQDGNFRSRAIMFSLHSKDPWHTHTHTQTHSHTSHAHCENLGVGVGEMVTRACNWVLQDPFNIFICTLARVEMAKFAPKVTERWVWAARISMDGGVAGCSLGISLTISVLSSR